MKRAPARTRVTQLGRVRRTPPGLGGFESLNAIAHEATLTGGRAAAGWPLG